MDGLREWVPGLSPVEDRELVPFVPVPGFLGVGVADMGETPRVIAVTIRPGSVTVSGVLKWMNWDSGVGCGLVAMIDPCGSRR